MYHRINTRAATAAFGAAISAVVAATVTATPAAAHGTCTETRERCPLATVSPYADPVRALGGRTLAQYVSDHQAGDVRTRETG